MIGSGWVNDELVSVVATDDGVVVTDSSVVGNVEVPFAFTDGAEVTTAVSVVGNNGTVADGAGELAVSAVCGSGFSGSAGALELFFADCWSLTCCCNVCTISLSDLTSSRSASTSAVVAGVEPDGGDWAERRAVAQRASATQIKFLI